METGVHFEGLIDICVRRFLFSGTVDNPTAIQIIRRHLNPYCVSEQNADVISAHSSGKVSHYFMPVIQEHAKLRAGEGFDNRTVDCNLLFFFSHNTSLTRLFLVRLPESTSNSLLIIHTALLALGNKPAFATYGAQYTTLNDLFTEAFEQGILRFIRS